MPEGKTIGQLMEEMRQKAGAQNYHGHDYMDLQRFAENTRHMIIFDVLTQLITVTTKAGNYFYILIDRANEDKKTAVHFLNQVDEADLMALMEDGKPKEEPPAVCSCSTKCETGTVNTACPVCATDMSKCTGKAPEPPAETPEPEKEKPAGLNPAVLILLLALFGGGGVFAYLDRKSVV